MKISNLWSVQRLRWLVVLGMAVLGPALAQTANYNIVLKPFGRGGEILMPPDCSTGGFAFTKTTVGEFDTSGASVNLAATCPNPPITTIAQGTYGGGNLDVDVQLVTLNGQDQGPNVVGLTGTLEKTEAGDCSGGGSGTRTLTITFSSSTVAPAPPTATTRQFSIVCSGTIGGAGTFATINGTYHVYNINSIPEPGSLWIVLLGLSLIVVSRRVFVRPQ